MIQCFTAQSVSSIDFISLKPIIVSVSLWVYALDNMLIMYLALKKNY